MEQYFNINGSWCAWQPVVWTLTDGHLAARGRKTRIFSVRCRLFTVCSAHGTYARGYRRLRGVTTQRRDSSPLIGKKKVFPIDLQGRISLVDIHSSLHTVFRSQPGSKTLFWHWDVGLAWCRVAPLKRFLGTWHKREATTMYLLVGLPTFNVDDLYADPENKRRLKRTTAGLTTVKADAEQTRSSL